MACEGVHADVFDVTGGGSRDSGVSLEAGSRLVIPIHFYQAGYTRSKEALAFQLADTGVVQDLSLVSCLT